MDLGGYVWCSIDYTCMLFDEISGLAVSLPANQAYGHVEVARYGVIGSICDGGWTDKEARVVCTELGFRSGNATKGTAKRSMPTLVGGVNCTGSEKSLDQCDVTPFLHDHNCLTSASRAAVVCSKEESMLILLMNNKYTEINQILDELFITKIG